MASHHWIYSDSYFDWIGFAVYKYFADDSFSVQHRAVFYFDRDGVEIHCLECPDAEEQEREEKELKHEKIVRAGK